MDVNLIAQAIADVLAAVDEVDGALVSGYQLPHDTQSVFALVVPFDQESTFEQTDLGGASVLAHHLLQIEFWCKHDPAAPDRTLERARNIGTRAVAALMESDGDGYTIDREMNFRERVDGGFVTIGNVPWLVAHLYVPLENEVGL